MEKVFTATFDCMVEREVVQLVTCEKRNGEVFFIFRSEISDSQTAVIADTYLEMLQDIRGQVK